VASSARQIRGRAAATDDGVEILASDNTLRSLFVPRTSQRHSSCFISACAHENASCTRSPARVFCATTTVFGGSCHVSDSRYRGPLLAGFFFIVLAGAASRCALSATSRAMRKTGSVLVGILGPPSGCRSVVEE